MGSEVEGNKNPQELEKLINRKIPTEECDNNNDSSTTKNDSVPPHYDDIVSADNHAHRSAVIDNIINSTEEQVQIAQPHSELPKLEMPPEILNVPSSATKNDDVPPHRDFVSADNHGSAVTDDENKIPNEQVRVLQPHSELPKPQMPPGILNYPPSTVKNDDFPSFPAVDMPAIGKFIRERSSGLSAAIAKGISSFKDESVDKPSSSPPSSRNHQKVTEFSLSGVKVVVKEKSEEEQVMKGRISFFSRSNCRDCTAVRKFLRETGLKFVEINIDVYPEREKELRERTGTTAVPQIFLNEKLFGGLVALNSLRNIGGFEQRLLKETMSVKCPDHAPAPPVYGFNANEDYRMDEMVGYVRVLRQKLPIQDRLITLKMKFIQNCFTGSELVEVLIHHLDCGRKKVRLACRIPTYSFILKYFFNPFIFRKISIWSLIFILLTYLTNQFCLVQIRMLNLSVN